MNSFNGLTVWGISRDIDSPRALCVFFSREPTDDEMRTAHDLLVGRGAPIDMVLHCPACGLQHVDAPEPEMGPSIDGSGDMPLWTNPPHRSHLCHGCGHMWRPADVPTNGVTAITTKGKADSPIRERSAYEFAVSVRTKQGWNIAAGGPCPILYTDEINGRQVLRDDVWLCTTEYLTRSGRAIVAELVACKDLKDSAERETSAHERALTLDDYKHRKIAAWAAARAWLKEHTR